MIGKGSEQERYLRSLERSVRSKRRWGRGLVILTLLAIVASALAAWRHVSVSILAYAELSTQIEIERSEQDPDRLTLRYRPASVGKIGFRRQLDPQGARETELFDEATSNQVDRDQAFEWRSRETRDGDPIRVTYREGWTLKTVDLATPRRVEVASEGRARVVGRVVNATTNEPVAGVEARIPGASARALTGPDGAFVLTGVPEGMVGIEFAAPGFTTETFERELKAAEETRLNVVLSPGLEAGQIRVVLTWGDEPADLDAHLDGPSPHGDRFHVYFQAKGDLKSREFVSLDVDDRDGGGPETITVLGVANGVYRFFVHDYSHRTEQDSAWLAQSGAEVRVYHGGQSRRFRTNGRSLGNLWRVCEIEVNGETAVTRRIDVYETEILQERARPIDVVFLLDTTSSMSPYIEGLKNKCLQFADTVAQGHRDARLGLVAFRDVLILEPLIAFDPVGDPAQFRAQVAQCRAEGGGDAPESAIDAIERALRMPLRPEAVRCLVLITDDTCHRFEEIPKFSTQLRELGVRTYIAAPRNLAEFYGPLIEGGGGKFYSFEEAQFEDVLISIAEDVKSYVPAN